LNFVYVTGLQFNASWSVYPPRPGRPGSPGGLGIFECSDNGTAEVEESPFEEEFEEPGESEDVCVTKRERVRATLFGYGEE
jgi:hypothetical protein